MKKYSLEYVSKRLVERGSKKAFRTAADKAIQDNGYVVIEKDGWIVKEFLDGKIEFIKEVDSSGVDHELLLD